MIFKKFWPLNGGQFYPTNKAKFAIALHHTAGSSILEAFKWWNQTKEAVGTPYGIERNGDIYECFPDEQWAWQFGITYLNHEDKLKFEQGVVGIELASYGWLIEKDGKFFACPLGESNKARVEIKKEDVIELDKPWRGYKFYHKYTDAQIKATVELCRYLVDKFKISVQEDLTNFWDYDISVAKKCKSGIWSHTTIREPGSGKWDIYPDERLLKALKAEFNTGTPKVKVFKLETPYMFDEVLKPIQTKLKTLKLYNDEVDGKFGKNTKKAVEAFQKNNNLKVTGEIVKDDKTFSLLSCN